jgi:hypothetical protein
MGYTLSFVVYQRIVSLNWKRNQVGGALRSDTWALLVRSRPPFSNHSSQLQLQSISTLFTGVTFQVIMPSSFFDSNSLFTHSDFKSGDF